MLLDARIRLQKTIASVNHLKSVSTPLGQHYELGPNSVLDTSHIFLARPGAGAHGNERYAR